MYHAGLGAVLRAGRSCVEGLALGGDLGQRVDDGVRYHYVGRWTTSATTPTTTLPLARCPATTTNPLSTISHIASPFDECAPL